jgi:hypothetical protein
MLIAGLLVQRTPRRRAKTPEATTRNSAILQAAPTDVVLIVRARARLPRAIGGCWCAAGHSPAHDPRRHAAGARRALLDAIAHVDSPGR